MHRRCIQRDCLLGARHRRCAGSLRNWTHLRTMPLHSCGTRLLGPCPSTYNVKQYSHYIHLFTTENETKATYNCTKQANPCRKYSSAGLNSWCLKSISCACCLWPAQCWPYCPRLQSCVLLYRVPRHSQCLWHASHHFSCMIKLWRALCIAVRRLNTTQEQKPLKVHNWRKSCPVACNLLTVLRSKVKVMMLGYKICHSFWTKRQYELRNMVYQSVVRMCKSTR